MIWESRREPNLEMKVEAMADLRVHHAVKPKPGESTIYDVNTLYEPVPGDEPLYYPNPQKQYHISFPPTEIVVSSRTYTDTTFLTYITDWELALTRIVLDEPKNPLTTIRIIAQLERPGAPEETVLVTNHDFIPSTYSPTYYELVKIDLFADAAYRWVLLYGNRESTYGPSSATAVALRGDGASKDIYYEAVLINKSTEETVTLKGSSSSYRVYNSPFNDVLAMKGPSAGRIIRGDCKGTVTMTETPESD